MTYERSLLSVQYLKQFKIVRQLYRVYMFCLMVIGTCIVLPLVLLRPIIRVRIGILIYQRIGHLAANTEYWMRKNSLQPKADEINVFFSSPKAANRQLLKMISRKVSVIKSALLSNILFETQKKWPKLSVWIPLDTLGPFDYQVWSNSKPQLSFTEAEIIKGRNLLRAMGIPEGAPYVCFSVRDNAYLDMKFPGGDHHYHDYRDADIENCRLMAEWLAGQGIWVLRMGAVIEKPFISENPQIVDYAVKHRTDFGDIFLLGHCKFFVGDTAGVFWPAAILGVPVALANIVPITHLIPISGSMLLPKKYRKVGTNNELPYREIVRMGADGYLFTEEYHKAGIELVENTPEEILGMVKEINARIDGTWVSTPEDEELHEKFWSIFPPGHPSSNCPVRVPIDFLRLNRSLIR